MGYAKQRRYTGAAVRGRTGLTLVECMLATVVLSVAVLGITVATLSGHGHLAFSESRMRAVRLAEHLIEEILSRRFGGTGGGDRSTWHMDDYDGFQETQGLLRDGLGILYAAADQQFSRAASVAPQSHVMTELDDAVIDGKLVVVTVREPEGREWAVSRFVREPVSP